MRILVVEDEKRIADFLCRGLQGAGYAVDAAPTGAAALDCIHSTDYDLVILDLMLPDVDGLQVLARIRNRKLGPRHIRACLPTGARSPEAMLRCCGAKVQSGAATVPPASAGTPE